MSRLYILDEEGLPIPEEDTGKWGRWMQDNDRRVARDTVGDMEVSTVFLGSDHRFGPGLPILWETMIFGGPFDGSKGEYQQRYTSLERAKLGHAVALKVAQAAAAGGLAGALDELDT
jgi:hypothetical protein